MIQGKPLFKNIPACTDINNCDSCTNPGPLCDDCPDTYVLSSDRTSCLGKYCRSWNEALSSQLHIFLKHEKKNPKLKKIGVKQSFRKK
jgi:hypothetical protein